MVKNIRQKIKKILLLSFIVIISNCTSAPRYHSSIIRNSEKTVETKNPPLLTKGKQHTAIFTASYYGDKFHGKLASNGQVFDMHDYTAAHKTLAFGTILKVTYPVTKKSVTVRVTDRGPFVKGRDLDLSFGAASKIGLVKNGVGKVKVTVVKWGDGKTFHKKD